MTILKIPTLANTPRCKIFSAVYNENRTTPFCIFICLARNLGMADFMNVAENPDEPTNKQTDSNELLVFGYQCKLYRDDQKAKYIDGGKHLIPWMDDPSLFIDRCVNTAYIQH